MRAWVVFCLCPPVRQSCAFVDAGFVREGLLHALVDMWAVGPPPPTPSAAAYVDASQESEVEAMRSSARQSAVLATMAIGGLMLGCPGHMVSRHIDEARRHRAKFAGLRDQSAVSALILFAFVNKLLPPSDESVAKLQEQEYRSGMDEAQETFDSLPNKDPLVNAFLMYRAASDGLFSRLENSAYSSNPVNSVTSEEEPMAATASGRRSCGGRSEGYLDIIPEKPAPAKLVAKITTKRSFRLGTRAPAHPAYVFADGE